MRFEQTRDVLEHVEAFHHEAGALYRDLHEKAASTRVRMLLDYLARHEENLARSVADFRKESAKMVLDSWFKYTHDQDIFKPLRAVDMTRGPDFDEALELAMMLDEKLLELYREMAERARAPEVKDVFNNLLLREMQEKQKLMRSALGLLDL